MGIAQRAQFSEDLLSFYSLAALFAFIQKLIQLSGFKVIRMFNMIKSRERSGHHSLCGGVLTRRQTIIDQTLNVGGQ